jgi:glyceraldehyde-3-phosphate dehydrogenase (NADP+)
VVRTYGFYLAGEWKETERKVPITFPYDDRVVGEVSFASADDVAAAIGKAEAALPEMGSLPAWRRAEALRSVSDRIRTRAEDLARTMVLESGKTIRDARGEVARAANTFLIAAEEAKRMGGEVLGLDAYRGHEGRIAIVRRVPLGVVGAITPFNFPLNLVAHKIGPALACGAPVVLKPASKTPLVALMLAELLDEVDLPEGAVSILPTRPEDAAALADDDRVKVLTFTGSPPVGWALKRRAWRKRVILELGGNAGVVVEPDADLEWAAERILFGGFGSNGQSCISVQRVYVHDAVHDDFLEAFRERVRKLRYGDPLDESTDVGPLIDEDAARRTKAWIDEAVAQGARVEVGGEVHGRVLAPTILTDVAPDMKVCRQEVFAPLVVLFRYGDFAEALAAVNDSAYGLQAGVFTRDIDKIWRAYRTWDVGGVIANDVPTYRADEMPYGGTKESGTGREGPRYALEDYTERRTLVIKL